MKNRKRMRTPRRANSSSFILPPSSFPPARSGGAVIIIVLTLLATLAFLGFFFYQWTDQEQVSARTYASTEQYEINPDEILDKAWEQILVGTRPGYETSALWGGKHSILAHILGTIRAHDPVNPTFPSLHPSDDQPFSGTGIEITYDDDDNSGTYDIGEFIRFDFDGDGYPDCTLDPATDTYTDQDGDPIRPLALNFSRVARTEIGANYNSDIFNQGTSYDGVFGNYRPDTGVTYPDINNLFLAYDAIVGGRRVVIPSFMRPQLEAVRRDVGDAGFADYFFDANVAPRSLRPHASHSSFAAATFPVPTTNRFLFAQFGSNAATIGTPAQSGNTNRLIPPFEIVYDTDGDGVFDSSGNDVDSDGFRNEMGVLTGTGDVYEFDVDTDGDGVRDAIWMDLGLPMIDLPDGRQVVPLVAVKILDADGLLNVNAHGNGQGVFALSEVPPPPGVSISKSNQGLSPAEVNPIWALFGDSDLSTTALELPSFATLKEFAAMFSSPIDSLEAANMELMFMLIGRIPPDGRSTLPGRNGEAQLLTAAPPLFPRAGVTDQPAAGIAGDDDGDQADGSEQDMHSHQFNGVALNRPPAVHPLDLIGTGNRPHDGTNYQSYLRQQADPINQPTAGAQRLLTNPVANNPSAWPNYRGVWHQNMGIAYDIRGYWQAVGGALQGYPATPGSDVLDEENELTANAWFPSHFDSVFLPGEMAGLQLSNSDFALTGEHSRLRELLPFAFRDAANASTIRRRFTTDSWDRLEFAHALRNPANDTWGDPSGSNPDQAVPRRSEFSTWNGTGFEGITFQATDLHFPPRFGAVGTKIDVGTDLDPFRRELRLSLWSRMRMDGSIIDATNIGASRSHAGNRFNLTQLLEGVDANGNPIERPLIPHPGSTELAAAAGPLEPMLHQQHASGATAPGFAPYAFATIAGNATAQEWWARYDRQRMARDIYTLLWTVGGGQDLIDYSTPATLPVVLYTPEQAREMAQFAVNIVDEMDHDDVITRFEYDPDLSNGWDVNIADGRAGSTIEAVYGVEGAQLTFSEVLAIHTPPSMSQSHDDKIEYEDANDHFHLFIELRNASAFSVPVANDQWRVRRIRTPLPDHRYVVIRDNVVTDGTTTGMIGPGDIYLIASQDGTNTFGGNQYRSSDFRVDYNDDNSYDLIVPNVTEAMPPTDATTFASYPAPHCDLDLFAPAHNGRYLANSDASAPINNFTTTDSLLNQTDRMAEGATPVIFVLERRMNPYDTGSVLGAENRWIEVDRVSDVVVQEFNIGNGAQTTELLMEELTSFERSEPLNPALVEFTAVPGLPPQTHTMPRQTPTAAQPEQNSNSPAAWNFWQPHFDRDFTSVIDLLSIPLYGYADADMAADAALDTNRNMYFGGPTKNVVDNTGSLVMNGVRAAVVRFANPYPVAQQPHTAAIGHLANRWYRLLEFVTVPDRVEESVRDRLTWKRRTPGRININTIRDAATLAGILDDADQIQAMQILANPYGPDGQPGVSGTDDDMDSTTDEADEYLWAGSDDVHLTMDGYDDNDRNWMANLLAKRDGDDPLLNYPIVPPPTAPASMRDVRIPGNINSKPFRNLSWVDPVVDTSAAGDERRARSIDSTILRSLTRLPHSPPAPTAPVPPTNSFGVFEARTPADLPNNTVDFHTRQRLLAKLYNRTTNRSHVFMVWTTIGFFEAHRLGPASPAAGEIQIGGEAQDIPRRRAFMVCDMTRIEEAYSDANLTDDVPGSFDFRKFIIYRKVLK